MKKIFLFFIFLILIININWVIAISFSPGHLNYNLNLNQKECKTIKIDSKSQALSISDRWAENKSQEKKPGFYTKKPSYHGLVVEYPAEIKSENKTFEVCISGKYSGEFYGIVIMQEEQFGNTIMQGGVWLNVIINGSNYKPAGQDTEIEEKVQETQASNKITGAAIAVDNKSFGFWNILVIAAIILLVIIIAGILIYNKKRKERY